ncbi:hypothetical protein [[Actinomadura] parvosata]|uniref:hypothetical protein n=1 Tax=[Actinomadura] parvosata TaxID=1955412 RepID=UPI001E33127C|nr:hypothetical protein [Nonomuraea sp. ATCC 55076]
MTNLFNRLNAAIEEPAGTSWGWSGLGELNMTAMYGRHEALRREVTALARLTVQASRDARHVLRWRRFKHFAPMPLRGRGRGAVAAAAPGSGPPAGDPDAAEGVEGRARPSSTSSSTPSTRHRPADAGPGRLGGLTDALITSLTGHLRHEERALLPLVHQALTPSPWAYFTHLDTHRSTPP